MLNFIRWAAVAALVALAAGCNGGSPSGAPVPIPNVNFVAVTDTGALIAFQASTPTSVTALAAISGLQAGEAPIAADFRPVNGALYILTDQDRLYTVDLGTGAATLVGSVPVNGAVVSIDFNPTVDRLRVVSEQNDNLRVNPDNASVTADTAPAYAPGDPNAGVTPNIQAIAYTNSQSPGTPSPTATTLFVIDASRDDLITLGGSNGSPSPNTGQLFTRASFSENLANGIGFDIPGGTSFGFFAAKRQAGGDTTLFVVDLNSGLLNTLGTIGNGVSGVRALAIRP